jgi:hypothetical protein
VRSLLVTKGKKKPPEGSSWTLEKQKTLFFAVIVPKNDPTLLLLVHARIEAIDALLHKVG